MEWCLVFECEIKDGQTVKPPDQKTYFEPRVCSKCTFGYAGECANRVSK